MMMMIMIMANKRIDLLKTEKLLADLIVTKKKCGFKCIKAGE